jgi:succinoglycan biosynthesis protein ExoM
VQEGGLDGVLAPVIPQVPDDAPEWIRKGNFYDFARLPTGSEIPPNQLRFGNVMLRGAPLRALPGPFDVAYALMTGEDADLLLRLIAKGARVRWNDEAPVFEPVEANRLSLKWLTQRAYSGGQEYARKMLKGSYGALGVGGRLALFVNALGKAFVALPLALASLPLGRHKAAHWLVRGMANVGKLTAFTGSQYQEYRTASASGGR